MKWKIQYKGPETIETKVCLAFKLDTSNYHMDQIETQLHSRIQNFICSIPICPRFESTKVAQTFDSRAFKISYHILAIIYYNLSQAYRFYHSEIVPSVQLNTRKLPERTKQKRFYGLRWIVIENSAGFHSTTIEYGSWDEQVLSATWDIHVSRS